jgi:molecular chaperone GrpE
LAKNKQNSEKKQENTETEEKTVEDLPEIKEETKEPEPPKTELEMAKEKIEDLTDTLKRLQAEFENYKKRVDKDNKQYREYSNAGVLLKILPIIDTFEIALKDTCDSDKFKEGAKLIYAELMGMLRNEGVEKINSLGKQFDPNFHDAMLAVESKDSKKDMVVEVLQEGYRIKDKVLRHSKVKISK